MGQWHSQVTNDAWALYTLFFGGGGGGGGQWGRGSAGLESKVVLTHDFSIRECSTKVPSLF